MLGLLLVISYAASTPLRLCRMWSERLEVTQVCYGLLTETYENYDVMSGQCWRLCCPEWTKPGRRVKNYLTHFIKREGYN